MPSTFVAFVDNKGRVKEMFRDGRLCWHLDTFEKGLSYVRVTGPDAEHLYWRHYAHVRLRAERWLASDNPTEQDRGERLRTNMQANGSWDVPVQYLREATPHA